MTYDEYINETASFGFLQKGKTAYGEYNGFPLYCVFGGNASAKWVTLFVSLNKNCENPFLRAWNKALKGVGTVSRQNGNFTVAMVMLKTKEGFSGPFLQAMGILKEIAPEYGMRAPSVCPLCHQESCDGIALLRSAYTPVHRSCLERAHQGVRENAEQNLKKGSYLSGICGGLAGGIIATIPSILSIWFAERIFAVLMMLIPLGASFGYTKCNGKRSRAAGPILIVLSLLSMYVMEYVFWVLSFASGGFTMGEALIQTLPFLLDPSFWVEMTKSAVQELIFLAVAIAISWKTITATASTEVNAMSDCLNTYQPFGRKNS
jgi:hypothetical protein